MDRLKGRHVVSGVGLLVLSVGYFAASRGLPPGADEPGPAFFPGLLAGALFLLSFAVLFEREDAEKRPLPRLGPAIAVIALSALFILMLPRAGFVVSTFVYVVAIVALSQRQRTLVLLLVPVLMTAALYLLFIYALQIDFS